MLEVKNKYDIVIQRNKKFFQYKFEKISQYEFYNFKYFI